jgi:hypothetical protein
MALETMKELFGVMHIGEVEVPNAKRIRVQEEEVSLSQPVTAIVPPEEEEVPVPLEEDEVLVPQGPPPPFSWSHRTKGRPCAPWASLSR